MGMNPDRKKIYSNRPPKVEALLVEQFGIQLTWNGFGKLAYKTIPKPAADSGPMYTTDRRQERRQTRIVA